MRVLSEQEMDEVFGGQATDQVTTRLPTVTVNGSQLTSYGGGYWIGDSGGFSSYDENSGSSGACYMCSDGSYECYPRNALPDVPSPEKLKCIMDAVATPGNDLRTEFRFAVVNSYGYYNFDTRTLQVSANNIAPPAGFTAINGLTVPTNVTQGNSYSGTSTIYAGGLDGSSDGNATYDSYYDETGGVVNSYALGVMSSIEEAILTTAHEARHQYTSLNPALLGSRDAEADARTYAIQALEKYRTGAGQNCN